MRVEQIAPNQPPEAVVQRRQQPVPPEEQKQGSGPPPEAVVREERSSRSLEQTLAAAIEHANRMLEIRGRSFNYSVHEPTNELIVRVIDTETDELIKEIPPEEILDLVAKMWELAGIFVDERR